MCKKLSSSEISSHFLDDTQFGNDSMKILEEKVPEMPRLDHLYMYIGNSYFSFRLFNTFLLGDTNATEDGSKGLKSALSNKGFGVKEYKGYWD